MLRRVLTTLGLAVFWTGCWNASRAEPFSVASPLTPPAAPGASFPAPMLSAHWGVADNPAWGGQDGVPVVFSAEVDPMTVDPAAFVVRLSDGSVVVPEQAVLAPASEADENRTILLIGNFGAPGECPGESATTSQEGSLAAEEPPVSELDDRAGRSGRSGGADGSDGSDGLGSSDGSDGAAGSDKSDKSDGSDGSSAEKSAKEAEGQSPTAETMPPCKAVVPRAVMITGVIYTEEGRRIDGVAREVEPFETPGRVVAVEFLRPAEGRCARFSGVLRTYWLDGLRGVEHDDLAKITVKLRGGSQHRPVAFDDHDLEDESAEDNVLDLCLDVPGEPTHLRIEAGIFRDPPGHPSDAIDLEIPQMEVTPT